MNSTNNYGELIDSSTVRFERMLAGPIDRVWSYLTDGEKRAKWLAGGDTEPREGGQIELHFHHASLSNKTDIEKPAKYADMPEEVRFSGTVTRYEPPNIFAHTWEWENECTEVCYELEECGDAVRLVLTHRKLDSREDKLNVSTGWHTHLDILCEVLEGREPEAFWKRHTPLEAEYDQRLE